LIKRVVRIAAIAACLLFSAVKPAASENQFPYYTSRYDMTAPSSVYDNSRRAAVVFSNSNPILPGFELPVFRGDSLVGLLHITQTGNVNAYGDFFSHINGFFLTKGDRIAVPLADTLPPRLPDESLAQIILTSMSQDGLWLVIDRGAVNGVSAGDQAAALLDGVYVGFMKIIFAGRKISYGLLIRDAILPYTETPKLIIDLKQKGPFEEKFTFTPPLIPKPDKMMPTQKAKKQKPAQPAPKAPPAKNTSGLSKVKIVVPSN